MNLNSKHTKTLFLTGLRGYAALAVFYTHFGGPWVTSFPFLSSFERAGQYGVIAFFIISAFSIYMSFHQSSNFHFLSYLKRRFFRIAPIYYIVILFGFLTAFSAWKYPGTPRFDFIDLFSHIFFINLGEINFHYQNSLVGVEWTIAIEFFYYLILPIVFLNSQRKGLLILLIAISCFLFFDTKLYDMYVNPKNPVGFHWSLQKYFFIYMLGSVSYIAIYKKNTKRVQNLYIPLLSFFLTLYIIFNVATNERIFFCSLFIFFIYLIYLKKSVINKISSQCLRHIINNIDLILLTGILVFYIRQNFLEPSLFIALWTIVTIAASSFQTFLSKLLYENKIMIFMGNISYSFYLLQFPTQFILNKSIFTAVI